MNNCLAGVTLVFARSQQSGARRAGRLAQAAPPTRPDARRSRHSQM